MEELRRKNWEKKKRKKEKNKKRKKIGGNREDKRENIFILFPFLIYSYVGRKKYARISKDFKGGKEYLSGWPLYMYIPLSRSQVHW